MCGKDNKAVWWLVAIGLLSGFSVTGFCFEIRDGAGVVYENVEVVRVTPYHVFFTYVNGAKKGAAGLRLQDLPEEYQKRFNYLPEKARQYHEERVKLGAEVERSRQLAASSSVPVAEPEPQPVQEQPPQPVRAEPASAAPQSVYYEPEGSPYGCASVVYYVPAVQVNMRCPQSSRQLPVAPSRPAVTRSVPVGSYSTPIGSYSTPIGSYSTPVRSYVPVVPVNVQTAGFSRVSHDVGRAHVQASRRDHYRSEGCAGGGEHYRQPVHRNHSHRSAAIDRDADARSHHSCRSTPGSHKLRGLTGVVVARR